MTIIFQVFCAVFSGILSALAMPNELFTFGSTAIAFASMAPLYIAAKSSSSYKRTALLFAIDAFVCHMLSSYWLANFKDFAVFTLGASAFGTSCIEAMAGCIFFFQFAQSSKNRPLEGPLACNSCFYIEKRPFFFEPYRIFHFAAVRVIYEWAKSTGFLAYPWGVLSMAAFDNKVLMQSADIFGAYGLTFAMAFGGGILGEFLLLLPKRRFWSEIPLQNAKKALVCNAKCFLLLLSFATCYGSYRLLQSNPVVKSLKAVLVQQNMDPWASSDDNESLKISIKLSEDGAKEFFERGEEPDLIVWSEAVLRYAFPHSLKRYTFYPEEEPLFSFIQRMRTPFIIGGPYAMNVEKRKMANAALVFDKTSGFAGYYGKSHLVPFAEVIPGVEYAWVRNCMNRLVGFSNGWTAGGTFTLFDIDCSSNDSGEAFKFISVDGGETKPARPKARVATPICFEDAFPDICGPFHQAGAEVFVNITDDSWSKTKSAEYQHFAVAAFRAIEYRTSLVRSTNAGLTAVVDNRGRILQSLPLFEQGYLCADIPIYKWQSTVYADFTNWFPHLLLLIAAVLAFFKARELAPASMRELIRAELLKIEF